MGFPVLHSVTVHYSRVPCVARVCHPLEGCDMGVGYGGEEGKGGWRGTMAKLPLARSVDMHTALPHMSMITLCLH